MKNFALTLFVASLSLMMLSCHNNTQRIEDLGEVHYYPSFLGCSKGVFSEGIYYLDKTLTMNFSEDAKADSKCFATYVFVDDDNNPIPCDVLEVVVDNKRLTGENRFTVYSSQDKVAIRLRFYPQVKPGRYQGYLRLEEHNLDVQGCDGLVAGEQYNAIHWSITFSKGLHPVVWGLIFLGVGLLAAFLIWMFVIRPIRYPVFGSIQKTFIAPGMAPLIVRFKGARLVVISAVPQKKQSGWNRFWTGKIIYKIHPAFVNPIKFKPGKRNKIMAVVPAGMYQITPNPMPGIGGAKILDIKNNVKIDVN